MALKKKGDPIEEEYYGEDTQQSEGNITRQSFEQRADRMERQAREASKIYVDKANQMGSAAASTVRKATNDFKEDMNSAVTAKMMEKGKLGFAIYLYAVLGYGFFILENTTVLMLFTAWVIAYEHNRHLMRMMLNIIMLYLTIKIGYSVFISVYNFVTYLIPNWSVLQPLITLLTAFKKFVGFAYDMLFVLVGVSGMAKARRGDYIKLKSVEKMFQ